jgi:hypothetical protein
VDSKNNLPQKKQKAENENFKPYMICFFEETKAKFLSYKNFCVPFVPFVVFSFN